MKSTVAVKLIPGVTMKVMKNHARGCLEGNFPLCQNH